MKSRYSAAISGIIFYICCLISFLVACSKEKKIPCKSDFRIEAPIDVNHTASILTLRDTIKFAIDVPFKNLNVFVGDSVDLSLFSDLWGGFTVLRYIKDSNLNVPGGGVINAIPARGEFQYSSDINEFEIPLESDVQNPRALFFRWSKKTNSFRLNLKIIPTKKGVFTFNFLPSAFRDAVCFNKLSHQIIGYNNALYTKLIEDAIGKPLSGGNPYNPELYIIKVE